MVIRDIVDIGIIYVARLSTQRDVGAKEEEPSVRVFLREPYLYLRMEIKGLKKSTEEFGRRM